MLNSSASTNKFNKINEHIMRRRARNLRAKIKALLPVQNCCKYDHRNRCVHQIQNNRKAWSVLNHRKVWSLNQDKQNQYYAEQENNIGHFERFEKLTLAEIQQIKEDKLYYLGEANIKDFQLFLQSRQKNMQRLAETGVNLLAETFENFLQGKVPIIFKNFNRNSEQSQQFNLSFIHDDSMNNKIAVDQKLRQFSERRKIIQIQQRSKIVTNKVKLNMRLQRAEAKLKQLKTKKYQQLTLRKQQRQQYTLKVNNRRNNWNKKGQIKQLQLELRQNFLSKKVKTAKDLNKTARNQNFQYSS